MSHWLWMALTMAVLGAAIGLLAPRLRRRTQRGLYGPDVFDASVKSLGPSPHALSRGWGSPAGAVITAEGDLHWRGKVLPQGHLETAAPRTPQGRELVQLDPWSQVWTVAFADGTRVEVALAIGDAHFLRPWQTPAV